ncbi:hypothetical protein [Yoonia sp. 2307UL14-13]|uniref:hypothetical protein n=1 Tax=Yoonia sp. 2307UL14-13 TaxID=3126506 RepID=UPI0030A5374D
MEQNKSMTPINADHGSILPEGASALIVDEAGGLSFYMPTDDPDSDMAPMAQFPAAVLIKSKDSSWVDEMIASFEEINWN